MQIEDRRLAELTPYRANAKRHDAAQVANVAESIRQYGFVQPVVVDRDGVIVIGHCRALAAEKLGMVEVPCVCVDDLTPEQVNALRLVDNKTNESPWDLDLLAAELPELDLSAFDFERLSLCRLLRCGKGDEAGCAVLHLARRNRGLQLSRGMHGLGTGTASVLDMGEVSACPGAV